MHMYPHKVPGRCAQACADPCGLDRACRRLGARSGSRVPTADALLHRWTGKHGLIGQVAPGHGVLAQALGCMHVCVALRRGSRPRRLTSVGARTLTEVLGHGGAYPRIHHYPQKALSPKLQ